MNDQILSLIIPVYNRPHFLARLLQYYHDVSCPFMMVVADSSNEQNKAQNRKLIEAYQKTLIIKYLPYDSTINVYYKIAKTLSLSRSKYAVVCADDDFVVPSSIKLCVNFLDTNPDYSIAHGRVLVISFQSNMHDLSHHGLYTHIYRQRTIDFHEPEKRLDSHLLDYRPTFYSVHRSDTLIYSMQSAYERTIDYQFGELLQSCLSLIKGKAKCLDVLYMVRPENPNSSSRKSDSWIDLFKSDDYSQRYEKFGSCLAEALMSAQGMTKQRAEEVVDYAFQQYLRRIPKNSFEKIRGHTERVMRGLPTVARATILDRQFMVAMTRSPRESYLKLERELIARRAGMSLDRLLDVSSPYHHDFMPIYALVKRYPYGVPPLPEGIG